MLPVPRQSLSPVLAKGQRQQEGAGTPRQVKPKVSLSGFWALSSPRCPQSLPLGYELVRGSTRALQGAASSALGQEVKP